MNRTHVKNKSHRTARAAPRRWTLVWLVGICMVVAAFSVWTWIERQPNLDEMLTKAKQHMEQGEQQAAHEQLSAVLYEDPTHAMARLFRGQIASDIGDLKGAMDDWEKVPDNPPQLGSTGRFLEGSLLLRQGQARLAEEKLRRACELNSNYLQPHERLLQLYVLQMRRREILEQLIAIQMIRPPTLHELVLYLVAGQRILEPAAAIQQLRTFTASDPQDISSRIAMAKYYAEDGKVEDATRLLRELYRDYPREDRVAGAFASVLLQNSQLPEARKVLEGRSRDRTTSIELRQSLGNLAVHDGDIPGAIACFSQVLEENPDDLSSRYRLGSLYARAGQKEHSKRYLEEAVMIDRLQRQIMVIARGGNQQRETMIPLIIESGNTLIALRRPAEAMQWFAVVLSSDPQDQAANQGMNRAEKLLVELNHQASRQDVAAAVPASSVESGRNGKTITRVSNSADVAPSPVKISKITLREMERSKVDFQYFNGATGFKYLIESMGGGVVVLDYDNDGWPDLYFPQGCRLPYDAKDFSYVDKLFRNRGDGSFDDVTEEAGIQENRYSQGGTAGDIDNDGDVDLVVANYGRNTIYLNNGDGTFTDITESSGVDTEKMSSSVALADLDLDSDLDLYVVNYVDSIRVCRNAQGKISTCDPQNFHAEQDRVYCNLGDGTFRDVTEESGIVAPDGKGLGIVVADFDDNGWPDVYVANDGTPNFLFRNMTGTRTQPASNAPFRFAEEGLLSGAALNGQGQAEAGMGIACADLNGDLKLDLFVTNFYAEQNTYYLNQGDAFFQDATATSGLREPSLPMLGFGTQAIDLDLDSKPELFVANGHIDDRREDGIPWKMPAQLFYNLERGRFADISKDCGPYFQRGCLGRGVARIDADRDGKPDLAVVHQDLPATILRNETPEVGGVVVLELHGTRSNRDAIGTRVWIQSETARHMLEICGGDGFYACNERRQFIGVGKSAQVDLEIQWPSGLRVTWPKIPARSAVILVEGEEPIIRPLN